MPDYVATSSLPARYDNGRFVPSNPGRRPGARGRTAHRVTMAIVDDFLEHKDTALAAARFFNGPAYLNTILKLLPTQVAVEPTDVRTWSDSDVAAAIDRVRAARTQTGNARDALIEPEAVLLGEIPAEPPPGPTGPPYLTVINGGF